MKRKKKSNVCFLMSDKKLFFLCGCCHSIFATITASKESVFGVSLRIQSECGKMQENADQNNSKYELFYAEDVCNNSYYNWHKLFYSLNFLHRNRLFTPPLKTSKLSLKVLFFKAAPQSDGLICAGHLMEKIPFNQPRSSLWQSFTGCSIHVQFSHIESPWCFLPIWHFLIKYILLSLQMYLVNSYEDVTKKSLHQLWFYELVLAFLKLRKSQSTSLNLIFWA